MLPQIAEDALKTSSWSSASSADHRRNMMNNSTTESTTGSNRLRGTFAILSAACLFGIGSTLALHAQTTSSRGFEGICSTASVAGDWAYTETGVVVPATVAVPFDAVARYTLDAEGELEGTATSSSGGTVADVTLKGSGTVNRDCTSTLTVGVYSSGTLIRTITFDVVYIDNARGARALVTSLVLANGTAVPAVLTIDARKIVHGLIR
jgi:hypothetical protein